MFVVRSPLCFYDARRLTLTIFKLLFPPMSAGHTTFSARECAAFGDPLKVVSSPASILIIGKRVLISVAVWSFGEQRERG
jgi:hypothetical protein